MIAPMKTLQNADAVSSMPRIFDMTSPLFPTYCGADKRLSISGAFSLVLNAAAAHCELIGTGVADMEERGLFWLMVRSRIRFHRRSYMMENAKLTTWPGRPSRLLCDRYYALSQGEELLMEARNEWAVLSLNTLRPTRTEAIYPDGFSALDASLLNEPFRRFQDDFCEEEAVKRVIVQPSDVDFGRHVNHALYLKMLTDSFSLTEWEALDAREIEVQYLSPCYEGEVLTVYRRKESNGFSFAIRKEDGKCALLAYLTVDR